MSDTQALLDALGKPFPREAVKRREGSRGKFFDYVAGHTIIHRLNHATGGLWDWEIRSFEFRPLPATVKGKEQWLVVVTGTLTIPGLGSRSGIGVQKVSEDAGEDLVKGASTDALKKAATLFGVALELYGDDYEDDDYAGSQPRPQQRRRDPDDDLPEYVPARATSAPHSNGSAPARVPTPPAAPGDLWTAIWTEARAQGINGREQLAGFLGVKPDALPAPAAILARLRDQPAPAEVR